MNRRNKHQITSGLSAEKLNGNSAKQLLPVVLIQINMTTDTYINENKTATFKKGDTVVMHSCGEAGFYKGKIWTCQTDSYLDRGKQEVVFLENFSGCFSAKYLQPVHTS